MKILVTGSEGFVGKNLITELTNKGYTDIYRFDIETNKELLDDYCIDADFVFHLAGVNRPQNEEEFMKGNFGITSELLEKLKKYGNKCPVMLSSSSQASLDNPYGVSKRAGEQLIFSYAEETGTRVLVYRFPNIFGKWCRPNYNSAVATFCHLIARNQPITVDDPTKIISLLYIDDVISELMKAIEGKETKKGYFCEVPVIYNVSLRNIVDLLYSFKESRESLAVPNMADDFTRKLHATYLSYLPEDDFVYDLSMHTDVRGSFTEFLKTPERGQISVNITKPGITKGNHWHHTKNEKFLVVSGVGIMRFRNVTGTDVMEYKVSGETLQVLDIPPGYTHNIQNTGHSNLITIMWANEAYDVEKPDTYPMEV